MVGGSVERDERIVEFEDDVGEERGKARKQTRNTKQRPKNHRVEGRGEWKREDE